jgi:hypothetical protein
MKFPQLLDYPERDKGAKELILFLFIYLFVAKVRQNIPHENIHGEGNLLENFQNKTEIVTF